MDAPPPPPVLSPNPPESPALKRATSGSTPLPLNLYVDDKEVFLGEADDLHAEKIARWWTGRNKLGKLREKFRGDAARRSLATVNDAMITVGKLGFTQAGQVLSNEKVMSSVKTILGVCARDGSLATFPRDSRSPRAFLSACMIIHHPTWTLNDGEENETESDESYLPKMLLQIASKVAMVATGKLLESVEGDCDLNSFEAAYNYFMFSRRFLASAMTAWRKVDSERLAASIVNPYSQTFAMLCVAERGEDKVMEGNAKMQLMKMKAAMKKLVGEARCESILGEVEIAVKQTMEDAFKQEDEEKERRAKKREENLKALEDKKEKREKERKEKEEEEGKKKDFVDKFLMNMSVTNERLCHEIILDPDYKIPGSSKEEEEGGGGEGGEREGGEDGEGERVEVAPAVSHAKKLSDNMKKVFWDRLVVSLTLPTQVELKDFVEGAEVQVRYGDRGAFYSGKIVKVNRDEESDGDDEDDVRAKWDNTTFDVVFTGDNVVQKNVPFKWFRTANDPVDYKPLLALIEEVRGKLISIAPKKGKFVDDILANMDLELLSQMLEKDAIGGESLQNLVNFIAHQILQFQAPVRNKKTAAWIKEYMEELNDGGGAAAVTKLPRLLEWVFERVDETQKDIANSHIDMLRPKLKESGKEYERERFDQRLESGQLRLTNTKIFLQGSLDFLARGGFDEKGGQVLLGCAKRDPQATLMFVASAVVQLLRRPVRLDTPGYETYEGGIPETLLWDCKKLAELRDAMDGVALISTMVMLLRQVLARNGYREEGAGGGGGVFDGIQKKLNILIKSNGVRLPDLEAFLVAKAKELCPGLPDTEQESLAHIIRNSLDAENAVFKLMNKRVDKLVFECLVFMKKEVWGRDGEQLKNKIVASGFRGFLGDGGLEKGLIGVVRVFKHTLDVHQVHYRKLILEVIGEHVKRKAGEGGGGVEKSAE